MRSCYLLDLSVDFKSSCSISFSLSPCVAKILLWSSAVSVYVSQENWQDTAGGFLTSDRWSCLSRWSHVLLLRLCTILSKIPGFEPSLICWNQDIFSRLLILISELMSCGLLGMSLAFPFSDTHTKSWGFFTKRFHQAWEFSFFPFKDMNIKMWAGDCSSSSVNCAFMLFQGIFHNSPGVCWRGWLRVDTWWYSDCSTSCPCCHSRE